MFIVIDGIDGAGKSTLAFQLDRLLTAYSPIVTKEPTSDSPWAQEIRIAATQGRFSKEKEIELFHKDRLHHLEHTILPALKNGRAVICDRYVDSMLAYQASSAAEADELYSRFAAEIKLPDITFILDCPVSLGLERVRRRDGDNLTKFETAETLEHAAKIFKSRVGPNHFHLDATGGPENTFDQAKKVLVQKFDFLSKTCRDFHFMATDVLKFEYA